MQNLGISFYLDIAISYVAFGLAIHAIAGIMALMWVGRKAGAPRRLRRDLYLASGSIIGLVVLDACRQIWDSLYSDHFPIAITRIALPILYLLLGHTLVSVAALINSKTPDNEKRQGETKGASPASSI